MAETFELEVATPERLVTREQVTEAQFPTTDGYIGILPGHAPLLSKLGTGYATYVAAGRKFYLAMDAGFIEVLQGKVRVLADRVEKADEIDVKRAEEALQRAQERLATPRVEMDIARALSAMQRAQARIDAATQARGA